MSLPRRFEQVGIVGSVILLTFPFAALLPLITV